MAKTALHKVQVFTVLLLLLLLMLQLLLILPSLQEVTVTLICHDKL